MLLGLPVLEPGSPSRSRFTSPRQVRNASGRGLRSRDGTDPVKRLEGSDNVNHLRKLGSSAQKVKPREGGEGGACQSTPKGLNRDRSHPGACGAAIDGHS